MISIYCLVRPWSIKRAPKTRRSHATAIIMLFTAAVCLAWYNAVPNDYETSLNTATRLLMHLAFYGILALETKTLREWSTYVMVYIGAVTADALFGMSTYLSQRMFDMLQTGYIMEFGSRRLSGIHGDPNFFAILIAPAILYGIASFPFFRTRRQQLYLLAVIVILVIALAMTLSRTGALALVSGLFAWAVMSRRKRLVVAAAILMVVAFAGSFRELGLGEQAVQRLDVHQGTSWSRRTTKWDTIASNLTVKSALTGGLGSSRVGGGITPHETYLCFILETGVLGVATYLAALAISVGGCWRFCRQSRIPKRSRDLCAAAASAAVSLFIGGFGLDLISERGTWVVLGLTAAACRLGRDESRLSFSRNLAQGRYAMGPAVTREILVRRNAEVDDSFPRLHPSGADG